ncbi:MAG: four helix bundle protein [Bacteroidetes bacterium]|nr:four helix bundle protein [Bacteroidota bacterium]
MKNIKAFEDLDVWHSAMELVQEVYAISDRFPSNEEAVLIRQMRNVAIKIPAKIGAGYSCGRKGMEFRFYAYALATLGMLQTHLELAARFKYVPEVEIKPLFEKTEKIGRMIEKLMLPDFEE